MGSHAAPALRAILAQIGLMTAAALGGWAFEWAGIPAPWLSGAMIVTAALAAADIAPPMVPAFRELALIIAGISMGASMTPSCVSAFADYPGSLAILAVSVVIVIAGSAAVLVHVSGWSARDALLASAPGALSTVLVIAADQGADVARIVVVQLVRLFVLVAILPMAIVAAEHGAGGAAPIRPPADAGALAILFAVSIAGAIACEKLNVAGAFILGPMLASGLVTAPGLVHGGVPPIFSLIGFVLIGVFIGQRFRGLEAMTVLRTAPAALVSFAASLSLSALGAVAVTAIVGVPFGETAVAFAPGGLEAMTVLAFALGLDPVYVGVHHLARFVLVAFLIPAAFRWWPGLKAEEPARDPT